jgi:hypothetical protein
MVRDAGCAWEHCSGLLAPTAGLAQSPAMTLRSCALVACLLALSLAGCESESAKCARLQKAAAAGWSSYEAVLKRENDAARITADNADKKLKGEIQERLAAEARKRADQLHGSDRSSAWWRTFDATQQALCAKDAECMELKSQSAEAKAKLADLSERLTAVQAAASSAAGDPDAAERAASAVQDDFTHAELKPARAASAEAIAACGSAKPSS